MDKYIIYSEQMSPFSSTLTLSPTQFLIPHVFLYLKFYVWIYIYNLYIHNEYTYVSSFDHPPPSPNLLNPSTCP